MFAIALAIYLLLAGEERPALIPYVALLAGAAYALRPINSLFVIAASLYVLERHRRQFGRYLLVALLPAAAFLAYNLGVYHRLFSPYFSTPPWSNFSMNLTARIAGSMAAQLISPSRGLLVFTPVLLFSLWGIYSAYQRRWQWPLSRYLALWILAHWMVISLFVDIWWAGHSYGPRWFTDLMPAFMFFLIPPLQAWQTMGRERRRVAAGVFLVLLGASSFIHARGAWSLEAQNWSGVPSDVDRNPDRAWDWGDPQFLRGLHSFRQ
jgi:hypothetical protein